MVRIEQDCVYETIELEPVLRHCKRVIDQMCRQGTIPAKKIGGKWLVEGGALLDFLKGTRRRY